MSIHLNDIDRKLVNMDRRAMTAELTRVQSEIQRLRILEARLQISLGVSHCGRSHSAD